MIIWGKYWHWIMSKAIQTEQVKFESIVFSGKSIWVIDNRANKLTEGALGPACAILSCSVQNRMDSCVVIRYEREIESGTKQKYCVDRCSQVWNFAMKRGKAKGWRGNTKCYSLSFLRKSSLWPEPQLAKTWFVRTLVWFVHGNFGVLSLKILISAWQNYAVSTTVF